MPDDEAKAMRIKPGFDNYARHWAPGERLTPLDGTLVRAYPDLETGNFGSYITIFDMYNVCQSVPAEFLEEVTPKYV